MTHFFRTIHNKIIKCKPHQCTWGLEISVAPTEEQRQSNYC